MRLKADWPTYLHELRAREAGLIFDRFGPGAFRRALELGAGDGFQSRLIRARSESLVSTDYRRPPLDDDTIEVRGLAAEEVAEAFAPGEFDLVYSSNMLEHVADPRVVLEGIAVVLADDGITIHVMPNRVWKACQMVLHVPNLGVTALHELISGRGARVLADRLGKARAGSGGDGPSEKNNPSVVRSERSLLHRLVLPLPHGVSATHREELAAFSRRRWETELKGAGFQLVVVLTGPLSSGYGFGLDTARRLLERAGVGSEYVYVAKKAGQASRHEHAFAGAPG
jgi:SAM-dependent methyltransferase